jgi:acyl-CoA reductase-like NAD-dependent aldehyde dehydrogenase
LSTTATNNHKKLKTINPTTEEVLNEYDQISKEQLNDTVKKSENAFLVTYAENLFPVGY